MDEIANRITTLLCISLLVLSSCNKKELPDISGAESPVFTSSGFIGEHKVDLKAGENEAILNTEIDSWNNVEYSTGTILKNEQSLSVSLFNHDVDIPALEHNFKELNSYPLANEILGLSLFNIEKSYFENSTFIQYIKWKVDGVEQTSDILVIEEPGRYEVCAEVHFENNFVETTCNEIIVGYKRNADFQLKWDFVANDNVLASIETSNNTVAEIAWYKNNELISNELEYLDTLQEDQFYLSAEVKFENGAKYKRNVFINRGQSYFSIEDWGRKDLSTMLKWDNNISVKYEKNGTVYQSVQTPENDAIFNVDEISEYENDELNSQIKLVKGKLIAPFKNTTTNEIVDGELELKIGLPY